VVELDRPAGGLAEVVLWGEQDEDMSWVDKWAGVTIRPSTLDGGGIRVGLPGALALRCLADSELARFAARRVSSIRRRRRRSRREDWHNRWLWALVDA
jgi:hypothetical protein